MAEFYGLEIRKVPTGKKDRPVVHVFESKKLRDLWVQRAPIKHVTHEVLREACSKDEAMILGQDPHGRFSGVRHIQS